MRFYDTSVITKFIAEHPKLVGEGDGVYIARMTELFKKSFQYWRADDLSFFRGLLSKHGRGFDTFPTELKIKLDPTFADHVLGDVPGVGWHSEHKHKNNDPGYSYSNRAVLAAVKRTYRASELTVMAKPKLGGNNSGTDSHGATSFFPADLDIEIIKSDALYVANKGKKVGLIIQGMGPRTGIEIDCLVNGTLVTSAYPHLWH